MKSIIISLLLLPLQSLAQLYIAPGDSISVLPGTLFTLQENLNNNGKIYNGGVLTLNGSSLQTLSGTASQVDNITADNNVQLLNDITVNNVLFLNSGKIFDISNSVLANTGEINGPGLLKGSLNAVLQLTGIGGSSISFDQSADAASNALKNMLVNNGNVLLQNKLYLYDALLPAGGTITLNDELVLRSNSSKTARVGVAAAGFVYNSNGKFVIERYIPGRRAWRLLTVPVTSGSSVKISDAWQDGKPRVTNVNSISNPEPGYGTHVTYGFPSANGYDQGVNGNPSIRYLNSTGWNGVPSATNDGSVSNSGIVTDQPGYMLFVRGDRGTLLSQATGALISETVLRPKGRINTGVVNIPLGTGFISGGSHFRVVGNPYPSAVNFHQVISSGLNLPGGFTDAYYLWDPAITGSNGVGGWVAMSYNGPASIAAGRPVYDRSVASAITNDGDIQSSAAFVIDYNGAATAILVQETDKSTESSNSFFRPAGQIQTTLLAENSDSTVSVNDGVLLLLDDQNAAVVDKNDMKKLGNFAENISIIKDSAYLCIEKRKPLTAGDTVFYFTKSLRQKKYQLQFDMDNQAVAAGTGVFLEDVYLKTYTPLHHSSSTLYPFSVTADNGSYSSSRFRLVCRNVNRITDLQVQLLKDDVLLQWLLSDTTGIVSFSIQRSEDGNTFTTVGHTTAASYTDAQLAAGIYYYRILCANDKGMISYSNIEKVQVPFVKTGLHIFPNPVTGTQIMLRSKSTPGGMYHLRLLDGNGKIISTANFNHGGGMLLHPLEVGAPFSNGIYQLEVYLAGRKIAVLSVMMSR